MKLNKINFKQPKYFLPPFVFGALTTIVYLGFDTFASEKSDPQVATDQINMSLPDAIAQEEKNKLEAMQLRYAEDDAFTAVGILGEEQENPEYIDHGYSEEELNELDAGNAEALRLRVQQEELERSLAESRRHINSYAYQDYQPEEDPREQYARELEEIQTRSYQRQLALQQGLGYGQSDQEDEIRLQRADSIQRVREIEREKNRPNLVLKSEESNAAKFNTVGSEVEDIEAPLIRAMIDQTTKAHEGTRLRFKLLDAVTVDGVRLKKGTYLYGTVTGFGQQRVRANITSIMYGNRFIKVNLGVFDVDGMEGFYVPESAFRDFMKEAGANVVQQNISFDSGYGSEISGEAIALQALQQMYNSATSAVSANLRKNRAKIKYNTIVYLINSEEAK